MQKPVEEVPNVVFTADPLSPPSLATVVLRVDEGSRPSVCLSGLSKESCRIDSTVKFYIEKSPLFRSLLSPEGRGQFFHEMGKKKEFKIKSTF